MISDESGLELVSCYGIWTALRIILQAQLASACAKVLLLVGVLGSARGIGLVFLFWFPVRVIFHEPICIRHTRARSRLSSDYPR